MKSTVARTLTLVFLLASFAFAGTPEYTVKAPDGWTKNANSAAKEHYMKNGVTLMLTVDTAPSDAKTPDAYVEFVKKQYVRAFKNVKFEPVKKVNINGVDSRELVYTAEVSGIKMKYDMVYIPKQSSYYTFTAGGLATSLDDLKAEYQAFFHSFKFVK
jgi:hypothetical protein